MIHNAVNEYWAGLSARYRASPLPGFLLWWRSELAGLVPESLRARMVPPRPALWLLARADGQGFEIWRGSEAPEHVDDFKLSEDASLQRDRWAELLQSFDEGAPEIRLCLPPEDVLQCPVEMPLAVESNLAAALGYQLDQLTPFRADQVYYDYRVAGRDTQHARIELDLRLVPVSRVEPLLERLAVLGVRPHVIDTLDESAEVPRREGFNLLPEAERPRYVYARARLNWLLAGAAVVVLALIMTQSLYHRDNKVERLQQEVAQLRAEADTVMALQRQLEDSLEAANFLAERRRQQPVVIQILDEISQILPDDIWLQQMQIRDDELTMTGLADGSQRMIGLMNDSPLFDDAEFRGAINVDRQTGQERFTVLAGIHSEEVRDAAVAGPGE